MPRTSSSPTCRRAGSDPCRCRPSPSVTTLVPASPNSSAESASTRPQRCRSAAADLMHALSIPHATTCVALRFADGVVMAGDRRATAGNLISHRSMDKVVEADRHSGVAIAGAAGPAMEMIRLFQLQLEHYEKVEGSHAQPRGQGQPAVDDGARQPAGGDAGHGRRADLRRLRPAARLRAGVGLTTSPAGGTRSATTWPPGRAACTPAPSSRSAGATRSIVTARSDLGVPRAVGGRRRRLGHGWSRCAARHLSDRRHDRRRRLAAASTTTISPRRFEAIVDGGACPMTHAVLRRPRTVDEGPRRLRAEGHRPGPGAGRGPLRRRHRDRGREPSRHAAQGQRDLRPDRLRRCRQVQRVRPAPRRRRARRRPQGLPVLPRRRRRALARQPVRPDPRQHLHPRDEADGGRDPRGRSRPRPRRRPDVPHPVRRHGDRPKRHRRARWRRRDDQEPARRDVDRRPRRCAEAVKLGVARWRARSRDPRQRPRGGELARTNGRRCFHRLAIGELEAALA